MFFTASRIVQVALEALPPAAALIVDEEMRIVDAEGSAFSRHGLPLDQAIGVPFTELLPAEARDTFVDHFRAALAGEPQSFDHWSTNRQYGYWVRIAPIDRREDSEGREVVAVLHDITERLRAVTELERSRHRLLEAERVGGVGSWELRPGDERITYSPGMAQLIGLDPDEELDLHRFLEMVLPADRDLVVQTIDECLREGRGACEYRLRRRDGALRTLVAQGEMIPAEDRDSMLMIGTASDVTEEREAERERAAALALLEQGFDGAPIGMVLTDPETDLYLRVNDAMCELLGRSREELLHHTFEEFTHPDDRREDRDGRNRMLSGEIASYEGEKRYLHPDGTAVWTSLHVTPVRGADGSVEAFFSQIVDIGAGKEREERLRRDIADAARLAQIRRALDEDGLLLHSQPIVDLSTGKRVQNELLLRMAGEDGTVHLPGEFLPVAERYGLISEIDRWVIGRAVQMAAAGVPTEFNLSGHSLDDPDVLRELEHQIAATGVDPSLLVVEVTETAVVDQFEAARRFAERIRELGCTLALDDFGTGFANLSYLKHIPAQHLKIDIEFVRDLVHSETDQRLVAGIVAFARAFDQKTVAEGVEDEATLIRLKELGVDMVQGYLLGRPRPLEDFAGRRTAPSREVCCDAVDRVKSAFEAFAHRDAEAMVRLCTDDVLLHPTGTIDDGKRRQPYRGRAGVYQYFEDVAAAWQSLELRPRTFIVSEGSVLVFGEAEGETAEAGLVTDMIWVWRLRGESISSLEAFRIRPQELA
jgi:PAS domain S-box-containing protein